MQASRFATLIPECCSEVLDSMYFVSVASAVIRPGVSPTACDEGFVFTVDYAGDFSGRFGVSVPAAAARTLAANFLGDDESELSEEQISDVIAELSNMLCGSVMSQAATDAKFALSHPQRVPDASLTESGDVLEVELETGLGNIVVWASVEGVACRS